jgi:hypothetical protein
MNKFTLRSFPPAPPEAMERICSVAGTINRTFWPFLTSEDYDQARLHLTKGFKLTSQAIIFLGESIVAEN